MSVIEKRREANQALPSRVNAAIVFADVQHYSAMARGDNQDDERLIEFLNRISQTAAKIRAEAAKELSRHVIKSAGDGFMLVYPDELDRPGHALQLALRHAFRIRAFFQHDNSLPNPLWLHVRVAVHYGPVGLVRDPWTGRTDAVGRNVIAGARLEPRTLPDMIWATEAVRNEMTRAALPAEFRFLLVGVISLAKQWGDERVFQVTSRNNPLDDKVYVRQYPRHEEADVGIHIEAPLDTLQKLHIMWGLSNSDVDLDLIRRLNGERLRQEVILHHRLMKSHYALPLLRVYVEPGVPVKFLPSGGETGLTYDAEDLRQYAGDSRILIPDKHPSFRWFQVPDMTK